MSNGHRKTWFITGASSGFGHAFASYALDKGYNVVATARNPSKLESLVAEAPAFGIKVLLVEPGNFRTNLLGSGTREMPAMDAYHLSVGGTREFARGMHGAQIGDPLKAAAAIDLALEAEKTPLRLQLGEDAVAAERAHAKTMLEDVEHWRPVAENTRVEGAVVTTKPLAATR